MLHNPYSPFIAPITVLLAEHKLNIDASKEKEISFFKLRIKQGHFTSCSFHTDYNVLMELPDGPIINVQGEGVSYADGV